MDSKIKKKLMSILNYQSKIQLQII